MEDIIASAVELERVAPSASKEKPGRIIVSTGRGGTGKSTFVALAGRYLELPLLLLHIDPDQSLDDMLEADLETVKIKTDIGRELKIKTL